jgi:hypothetical protein
VLTGETTRNRGRSVKEQLEAGQADADRDGVKIVETFIDDDRSASRHALSASAKPRADDRVD